MSTDDDHRGDDRVSDELFSQPFMYWIGINTSPDASDEDIAEFDEFYTSVHVPEVLDANPGFVRAIRYELAKPDPRGDFGPRWLTAYEIDSEEAAFGYLARADGPSEGRPVYTTGPSAWQSMRTMWRMIWKGVMSTGSADGLPSSIFTVGMSVPPDTDAAGLAAFNDFYSNIHVDEVLDWGGFQRGSRFELVRELAHPEPGSPQFCAVYETHQPQERSDKPANRNPFSSGPPAWEARDTRWRLTYRRIEM